MGEGTLWFALYTQPHKEYAVRDALQGQGMTTFLPEQANKVQRSDRRAHRPFFPHYLFLRNPGPETLASVRWTPGLRQVVMAGDRPAGIPEEVVQHIRQRLSTYEEPDEELFARGEQVHIISGPFEGMDAVFDRHLSSRERVRVFLEFVSRVQVPVEMDLQHLLPPY